MTNPTLILPERAPSSRPVRDPNVFAPVAGRDYATIALTAWFDAQLASFTVEDLAATIRETETMIQRAALWLRQHDATHPRHADASARRAGHTARHRALLVQYRCLTYSVWLHCCDMYAAMQHLNRSAWLAQHAPAISRIDTPQQVWRALRGEQPPPGAWPPDERESWVETRMERVEVWHLEDLRQMVERRQAG